jgi:hypothetical protein
MTLYRVTITTTEDMLGSAPADPEIYRSFIASKKLKEDKVKAAPEKLADLNAEEKQLADEEVKLLPQDDNGISVFRRNDEGIILMDFQIRGFLKEAAEAVSGIWGVRSKIDKWVFVRERIIPVMRNGAHVKQPDGVLERPLRAQTMQGPRTALAASEKLNPGVSMTFTLLVLPLGESKGRLNEETLRSWLEYGELNGLGQWRTGSNGRFTFTMEKME